MSLSLADHKHGELLRKKENIENAVLLSIVAIAGVPIAVLLSVGAELVGVTSCVTLFILVVAAVQVFLLASVLTVTLPSALLSLWRFIRGGK